MVMGGLFFGLFTPTEAAAVGVSNDYKGERIVAYFVQKNGAIVAPETLDNYRRDNLVKYKIPSEFIKLEKLPKTAVGKVDKKELKRLAESEN